ncbi:hypothetical protein D3C80_1548670 [compost metagenome]
MPGFVLTNLAEHINGTGIDRNIQRRHTFQRRLIQHVSGKHNLTVFAAGNKTRHQRSFNFAQRHGIDLHALLTHQAQDMNIGTGFLRKTDHIKLTQLRNARFDDLRVIRPHRAAKLLRQSQ